MHGYQQLMVGLARPEAEASYTLESEALPHDLRTPVPDT